MHATNLLVALLAALLLIPTLAGSEASADGTAAAAIAPPAEQPAAAAAAQETIAAPMVEKLHVALIGIMKNADQLGYKGRYDDLNPVVTTTFDLRFMAEKSVGRHWKKLAPEEQERWATSFSRLITANYAGRFDGWSGQSFETLGEEAAIRDTRVVRTILRNPEDEDVQLNYRLRKKGDDWRIIDIYLDGTVSELALRRAEYSSVLKREGFDKLISTIDDKVASLQESS